MMMCGDYHKIIVVGDQGVGKTSYMFKDFPTSAPGTVILMPEKRGNKIYRFLLVEKHTLNPFPCQVSGAIVMFSVNDSKSFGKVPGYIEELEAHGIKNIVLCANKVDLEDKVYFKLEDGYGGYPACGISSRSFYNCRAPLMLMIDLLEKNFDYTPKVRDSLLRKRKSELNTSEKLDLPLFASNPVNKEIYSVINKRRIFLQKEDKEKRKKLQEEIDLRMYNSIHADCIKEIDYLMAKIKGAPFLDRFGKETFRLPSGARNKKLRVVYHRLVELRKHIVNQYV